MVSQSIIFSPFHWAACFWSFSNGFIIFCVIFVLFQTSFSLWFLEVPDLKGNPYPKWIFVILFASIKILPLSLSPSLSFTVFYCAESAVPSQSASLRLQLLFSGVGCQLKTWYICLLHKMMYHINSPNHSFLSLVNSGTFVKDCQKNCFFQKHYAISITNIMALKLI